MVEWLEAVINWITGINTSSVIAPGITIATVSLVLQYISHRNSVLDSEFERQTKIHQFTGEQPVNLQNFTGEEYDITVELTKTVVVEKDSKIYDFWKYFWPLSDISGHTLLVFHLSRDGGMGYGLYAIEGWSNDSLIERGMIMNYSYQKSLLFIQVDSVDVRKVTPAIGLIADSPNLELTEDDEVLKKNLGVFG
jgi:hypothetical protein